MPAIIRTTVERIIVRRGRFLTYELLRRTFGDDPNVEIIWDRRRADEHAGGNGGVPVERRGRMPAEWDRMDYIVCSTKPSSPES